MPPLPRNVITLCGRCRRISGPFSELGGLSGRVYQLCACEADSEVNRPELTPTTPKFLCYTCAATLLGRSTKWAPAHCGPCRRRITELNTHARAVVIPVGWHTLVNAASVRSVPLSQPTANELHHQLNRIRAGFDLLEAWRRARIGELCVRAGLPTGEDLTITTYTDAVAAFDRAEALSELLAFIAERSLDEEHPPRGPTG